MGQSRGRRRASEGRSLDWGHGMNGQLMDLSHPPCTCSSFSEPFCTRHYLGSCERPRFPHPTLTT